MTIGDYIKAYRASHKMGSRAFADKCGISRSYLGVLERNFNPSTSMAPIPSLDTVKKVAAATDVTPEYLIELLSENGAIPYVENSSVRRPSTKEPKKDEVNSEPPKRKRRSSKNITPDPQKEREDISEAMSLDIAEAIRLVGHKYGYALSCLVVPAESEDQMRFNVDAFPDDQEQLFIRQFCSLPQNVYHAADVEWRTSYLEKQADYRDKKDWDAVCELMGLKPDDFGREIPCGFAGTVRIIGADSSLIQHRKTPSVRVRTLDVLTGKTSWFTIKRLKQFMPEYKDLPYLNTADSEYFELGEWVYWLNRPEAKNLTDPETGVSLTMDDYHKVIRLDRSEYEIAGYARLRRSNPVILRNLHRRGLRRASLDEVLMALGKI